jgi:hypothetical protein
MTAIRYPRRGWLMGVSLAAGVTAFGVVFTHAPSVGWFMFGAISIAVLVFSTLLVWRSWCARDLARMLARDDLIAIDETEWEALAAVPGRGHRWRDFTNTDVRDEIGVQRCRVEFKHDHDRVMFLLNR